MSVGSSKSTKTKDVIVDPYDHAAKSVAIVNKDGEWADNEHPLLVSFPVEMIDRVI